ncbi:FG-GAP repeat domain-containing protein [Polyangium mundeleinium]|uniref:VCBS repeat-containing protein n=1 Tax=Polyangium mundeleinium TaxID=2995306 RepID=A0ABT5EWA9_9BACT|nr:VCBS repeat-containing protein [Polyangium mundeleinium]MDC0746104.1 VCBS repeat-containing protein [Polyangium mundeleinium]
MVVRDFNGDDQLDIAAIVCETTADVYYGSRWANCSIVTLFGEGDGSFPTRVEAPLGFLRTYRDLDAGDFDGDGNQDLLALAGPDGLAVTFWHGFGNEKKFDEPIETIGCNTWADLDTSTPGGGYAWSTWDFPLSVTGEFGKDAATDTLIFSVGCNALVLDHGENALGNILELPLPPGGEPVVAVGDFCEGGASDLLFLGNYDLDIELYCGGGDSAFQFAPASVVHPFGDPGSASYHPGVRSLLTTDLNGDGNMDLVGLLGEATGPQGIATSRGNGNGTFSAFADSFYQQVSEDASMSPPRLLLGDFDNNGSADVAYLSEAGQSRHIIVVLLGNGQGGLVEYGDFEYESESHVSAVGDFDGDHVTDIAIAYGWGISTMSGSALMAVAAAKH